MKVIHQVHPEDFVSYDTQKIKDKFLLNNLLSPDKIEFVYTHYDRMMIGAACPVNSELKLETYDELKSEFFLQRRELGIASIGGNGTITVDGEAFSIGKLDCLYIGNGRRDVRFSCNDASNPAKFILFSAPAHAEYPTRLMKPSEALPAELGSLDNNNHRTINKYIHNDGIQSCQLVMGITVFKKGSIWNTMPPHTHDRRMEAYFYFDLPEAQRVIHFMGEPHETRHMFVNNEEGILSPAWSIHSGTATASYSFIWAMAGENKEFTDMDALPLSTLQ